jgi:K+-transporting ATPase KdpF subunit
MNDILFVGLTVAFFALAAVYVQFCAKVRRARGLTSRPPTSPCALASMETVIIGLLALACLVYLVAAVLRPEKF